LFAVIGYTYGGSGASFLVPDLTDRTVVGVSAANSKALAQSIGANTVTPTGNIAGSTGATTLATNQIPSHLHNLTTGAPAAESMTLRVAIPNVNFYNNPNSKDTQNTGGGQSHDHTLSANFAGSATSVLQPGLVLNYIIKT
jgi:hypothetical protein